MPDAHPHEHDEDKHAKKQAKAASKAAKKQAKAYRWFAGAELNTCYNAVDRHVDAGRGDQAAIIYDSPVTDTKQHHHLRELQDRVARFAGVLRDLGVGKGDRVIIYMPMVPEAAIAMLACARIGAIHSVVFGGFRARELATRIDDAKPKVIVSASCGIEPTASCLQAAARRRHRAGAHKPSAASSCSGRRPGELSRAATRLGRGDGGRRARRLRAGRGHRPALHPLHLRHHRRPRASCATTAATPSPCLVA
jgi:hypothetical protein